jgi:hypothetical protein
MSARTERLSNLGMPMRLCLFLASSPRARLKTSEVEELCGVQARGVNSILNPAIKAGLIDRQVNRGQGRETVYFAGPALLQAIGVTPHEPEPDEDAVAIVKRPAGTWERKHTGMAPAQWYEAVA